MYKMAECDTNVNSPIKHCSLCSDNSDIKKAVKLCVDCKFYLCDECVKYHSKFPLFKSHKVLGDLAEASGEIDGDLSGVFDYCTRHQGQVIDSYCKDHDNICCMICVTITHRSCENVLTLEEAATGIREKNELDGTKVNLNLAISKMKLEKEKRSNNISQLDEQKLTILNEIDTFQESIMKKIAMMTEASQEDVRSKHRELVNAVKKDIELLENVTSVTEENLNILNNAKGQSETKIFTNIKKSEKVVKDAEILVKDLPLKWPIRKLDYCIDYESPHNNASLKTFGHFIEDENKPANIPRLSERYKGVFDVHID